MYNNSFYISVDGISDTLTRISKFDMALHEEAKSIVRAYAVKIQKKAKMEAPVKTGNLKKSISVKYYHKGLSAHIFPSDEKIKRGMAATGKRQTYRHFVEYGTMDRYTKYVHPVFGTFRGKMKASRYMAKARESYQDSFASEIKKAVDKKVVV